MNKRSFLKTIALTPFLGLATFSHARTPTNHLDAINAKVGVEKIITLLKKLIAHHSKEINYQFSNSYLRITHLEKSIVSFLNYCVEREFIHSYGWDNRIIWEENQESYYTFFQLNLLNPTNHPLHYTNFHFKISASTTNTYILFPYEKNSP